MTGVTAPFGLLDCADLRVFQRSPERIAPNFENARHANNRLLPAVDHPAGMIDVIAGQFAPAAKGYPAPLSRC
jgi:hypothetical protein